MFKKGCILGVVSSDYKLFRYSNPREFISPVKWPDNRKCNKKSIFPPVMRTCSQKLAGMTTNCKNQQKKLPGQVCVCHLNYFLGVARHVFFLGASYISCGCSTYLQCWQHFHRVFFIPSVLFQLTHILSNSSKSSHPNRLGSGDMLIYSMPIRGLSPANFQPTCHVAKAPSKTSRFGVVFACLVFLLKVGFLRNKA